MSLARSGEIKDVCHPNALMTLTEYLEDYASADAKVIGTALVDRELDTIANPTIRDAARRNVEKIRSKKKRDLFF